MAEKYGSDYDNRNYFKEAVCIDAMRVYDSCSDKDCLEDIKIYFTPEQQQFIDSAKDVRLKEVKVANICIDTTELPFNQGYYTIDMTFYFDVCVELICTSVAPLLPLTGVAVFKKKCVMYGSEGGVKTFYSDCDESIDNASAMPRVAVQVADPVPLSAKICENKHVQSCCCVEDCGALPECICRRYGELDCRNRGKGIYATIGLFSIMQMTRNVQMLIPAYDFCIPTKECTCGEARSACDLFSTIDFPTDEFFPPKAKDSDDRFCGCN